MVTKNKIAKILNGYDAANIRIASLGGHSALDVCRGAKAEGFETIVVAERGRELTYEKYCGHCPARDPRTTA
jgi:5-formaminoimidazole-4-carboxamide-1-(beta)-D-ribofuranosyl 5'-monophosphate synthetase